MKPRRRTLAKLGLFLLAGAVVNVGVAAFGGLHAQFHPLFVLSDSETLLVAWPATAPYPPPTVTAYRPPKMANHSIVQSLLVTTDTFRGNTPNFLVTSHIRVGFPMRTAECSVTRFVEHYSPSNRWIEIRRGVPLERHSFLEPRVLPVGIITLGATINSGSYAALFYCTVGLVGCGRRHRRRARGLCPRCKYPLADLPTCPECGEAVRRKAAEA